MRTTRHHSPLRPPVGPLFQDRQRSGSPRSGNSPVVPNGATAHPGSTVRTAAPVAGHHGRSALSSARRCHSPWAATYSQSTHAQRVDNPGDNWGRPGTTATAPGGMHTTAEVSPRPPGVVHVVDTHAQQHRRPAVPTVHTPDYCYGNISPRNLFRRHCGDGSLATGAGGPGSTNTRTPQPVTLLESHVRKAVPWDAPSRRRPCLGRCPLPVVAYPSLEDRR